MVLEGKIRGDGHHRLSRIRAKQEGILPHRTHDRNFRLVQGEAPPGRGPVGTVQINPKRFAGIDRNGLDALRTIDIQIHRSRAIEFQVIPGHTGTDIHRLRIQGFFKTRTEIGTAADRHIGRHPGDIPCRNDLQDRLAIFQGRLGKGLRNDGFGQRQGRGRLAGQVDAIESESSFNKFTLNIIHCFCVGWQRLEKEGISGRSILSHGQFLVGRDSFRVKQGKPLPFHFQMGVRCHFDPPAGLIE